MSKVTQTILSTTKYFKIKNKGTDNYYFGKTDRPTIPKGSESISFYKYMVAVHGEKATKRAMREMQKIMHVTQKGSIEISTEQSIKHLPNANSEDFSKIINSN
jgi:hypothetical protein